MESVFLNILRMSATASVVILLVLLARLALRKAPKIFSYALWAVALFRLLCPFSVESAFSLLPRVKTQPVGEGMGTVQVYTGISVLNTQVNDYLAQHPYPVGGASIPGQENVPGPESPTGNAPLENAPAENAPFDWLGLGRMVWLAGAALLLGYSLVSLLRLRRKLVGWVPLEGEKRVRLADHIPSPFVLGVFRPRIYLPSGLPENERDYILLHERTHIRRGDHIFRALAWLAVAVHWFNPLVWLAFHLAGKDMEMSCDETVLRKMGRDIRADYSSSLLRLSAGGRLPAGPLAFGDGDPQGRIKNILGWKKPALWVMAAGLLLVLAACTALATDRGFASNSPEPPPFVSHSPGPAMVWVDYLNSPEEMPWSNGSEEIQLPEFPGVTFRWTPYEVTSITGDGEMKLLGGMPIWNVYFCDLDGDGCRELCATASYGSGMVDNRIHLYNYKWLSHCELQDRGVHDYALHMVGDQLAVEEREYVGGAVTRFGPLVLTEHGLDIGLGSGTGGAPALLSAELAFSLRQTDGGEPFVRMDGSVGDAVLERGAFWYPAPSALDGFPQGWLSMIYPGFTGGIEGHIIAGWADESRASVTVSTQTNAMLSSLYNVGYWKFTVDLDNGNVTAMKGLSFREGLPDSETRFYPQSISDGQAVQAALVAAKLLTAAEDYYYSQRGDAAEPSPSPVPSLPALDGIDFSRGWYEAINIEGLDAGETYWYPPGEYYPQGRLFFENPAFLGPAFAGQRIYGSIAWTDGTRTAMSGYLDLVDLPAWDFTIDLTQGSVSSSLAGFTDGDLIAMAQTCAVIMDKAADYKQALDSLPPEEGIMPFGRPLELEFSSGAGAWHTQLMIYPDGSFQGDFSDANMGDSGEGYPYGSEYICRFHGRFRDVLQVTDASWSLVLDELVLDTGRPVGEEWIEEGVQYISWTPYGFDKPEGEGYDVHSVPLGPGAKFMLYSPEARGYAPDDELYGMTYREDGNYDTIMGQFWTWQPWGSRVGRWGRDTVLGRWGLCNMETGYGFFSR